MWTIISLRRCLRAAVILTAGSLSVVSASGGENQDAASSLRDEMSRLAAPDELKPTWYRPREVQKGRTYPLAVILASQQFPTTNESFWIRTLWERNFCTLLLTCDSESWSTVRVRQVMDRISVRPAEVPADERLLLVADAETGPLALRMTDGLADQMVGLVLISVPPVEITAMGPALWSPRPEVWKVPIWSVVGTRPKDSALLLEMWRKVACFAPPTALLSIDPRMGRGIGHLLPDEAIKDWLGRIAAGEKPRRGPDRQVEGEKEQFGSLAQAIRKQMEKPSGGAEAGQKITKREGPFVVSMVAPKGWGRDKQGEKPFNPKGFQADMQGKNLPPGRNPYVEIYVTPSRRGPFFARIRAAEWPGSAAKLLNDFAHGLGAKGYLPVVIQHWEDGDWTYEVCSIQLVWGERWHRWIVLSGAKGGSKLSPGAPLIMVLNASDMPDPAEMAAAMKQLVRSVQIDWIGRNRTTTPQPLE